MIALLFDKSKKPKNSRPDSSSSRHSKGKTKRVRVSPLKKLMMNNFNYEISKSSSEEEENSEKEVD